MAAAAILKITAIIARICTELETEAEMGSRRQIYRQNSHSAKNEDGGNHHF